MVNLREKEFNNVWIQPGNARYRFIITIIGAIFGLVAARVGQTYFAVPGKVPLIGRAEGRHSVIRPVGPDSEKLIRILGRAGCVINGSFFDTPHSLMPDAWSHVMISQRCEHVRKLPFALNSSN